MDQERSCITPFIRRIQGELSRGNNAAGLIDEIPRYQRLSKRVYNVDVYCFHQIAVSSFFLKSVIYYESMRAQGVPLPDSNTLVCNTAKPINLVASILLRHPLKDPKHEVMARTYNTPSTSS